MDTGSTSVLGKNCYLQMAERNPNCDGLEAGVIVLAICGQDDHAGFKAVKVGVALGHLQITVLAQHDGAAGVLVLVVVVAVSAMNIEDSMGILTLLDLIDEAMILLGHHLA